MEKYTFTIPAYGKQDVNASGNRIYCETATAPFLLKSGNQTLDMKAKRMYVLKQGLQKFLLENVTAAPITVEVHIGDDEIIDNEVLITGTISGDVKIINSDTVGKTILKVDDDASQTLLDHIKQILTPMRNMQQDDYGYKGAGRNPYTGLDGASFASVNNATTTIVASATNVNGVLIKHADLSSEGNAGGVTLTVNGNTLCKTASATGIMTGKSIRDIFVPPGQAIACTAGAAGHLNMFYQVL